MNSVTVLVIDLLIFGLLLFRQLKVRPLGDGRFTLVLLALGIIELVGYTHQHRVAGVLLMYLGASLVGSVLLGALRAVTVRIWRRGDGQVLRQGTWLTALLWLVSVGGHIAAGLLLHGGEAAAVGATTLLFLGATLGVQQLVLRARAAALPATSGELAGAVR